MMACFET